MIFKYLLLILICFSIYILDPNVSNSNELSLTEEFRKTFSPIEIGINILNVENNQYLISIERAKIKDVSNKLNILKARRSANIKAERQIMEFVHGTNVKIQEVLTIETKIINKKEKTNEFFNENYYEEIKERGEGLISNIQELGAWYEKNFYYLVLGIKIK